jgi:hypothetical protein
MKLIDYLLLPFIVAIYLLLAIICPQALAKSEPEAGVHIDVWM